jgi:hypothetical protein
VLGALPATTHPAQFVGQQRGCRCPSPESTAMMTPSSDTGRSHPYPRRAAVVVPLRGRAKLPSTCRHSCPAGVSHFFVAARSAPGARGSPVPVQQGRPATSPARPPCRPHAHGSTFLSSSNPRRPCPRGCVALCPLQASSSSHPGTPDDLLPAGSAPACIAFERFCLTFPRSRRAPRTPLQYSNFAGRPAF